MNTKITAPTTTTTTTTTNPFNKSIPSSIPSTTVLNNDLEQLKNLVHDTKNNVTKINIQKIGI